MVGVLHCNRGGEKFEKFGVSPGSGFPRDIFYIGYGGRHRNNRGKKSVSFIKLLIVELITEDGGRRKRKASSQEFTTLNTRGIYMWEKRPTKQCYVVCRLNKSKRRKFSTDITNKPAYKRSLQTRNGCKQCNVPLYH